ncbi:MAG: DNA-directed RNA polymerase subunit omega [Deltaproteobacteria bacterium]|jgi:DNA-directed RNA polymerase subunit omega|nr:DNA-directed RNA polymerase subunit omega [Deltaproteobacteria bacterium]
MARVTIDDCLSHVDNRFSLIHLAAERARQLKKGARPLVPNRNKHIVLALREIAAGLITYENIKKFDPPLHSRDDDDSFGGPDDEGLTDD